LVIAGVITVGTAFAATTFDSSLGETPVTITGGNLNLVNGEIITTRNDGFDTRLNLFSNAGGQAAIKFRDIDDGQIYHVRLSPGGEQFEFLDGNDFSRDLVLKTATGNIGMGLGNPQERLDVDGNIRARGDLITDTGVIRTTTGDICIGNCP